MRICYLNPTILLRRPIAEISTKLAKEKNNEIAIFTPKKLFKKVDNSLHHKVEGVKIYTYSVVNPPFLSSEWPIPITPMFFVNMFRVLLRYDVLHVWTYFYLSTFFSLLFGKMFFWRTEKILTMDTIPGYSFNMPGFVNTAMKIYGKLGGWFIFIMPDQITLYGSSLKKYGRKILMPIKNVKVIPTGIDTEKFMGRYNNLKKEFGIVRDEKMILFVGLVVPRKGVDILIDVIERLNDEKIKMVIVGGGPDLKRYEKDVKNRGLSDKIIFTGWRKDVKDLYRSADVLFFPSRGEGLAGVIMEAMAAGLPVISSKIPCTTDLIEDGKSGFLCRVEDKEGYIKNLRKLIDDQGLRERFSNESREKIKDFSWDNVIEQYEELYR